MCGIFGISGHKEAGKITYLGLYALQHRGEESAGIVSYNKNNIIMKKGMGLVSDVFDKKSIDSLKGKVAIGHVRYSTTGGSHSKNIQPFFVKHKNGNLVIAHNGNLTNSFDLSTKLEQSGSIFQTSMDSEIVVHLLAKEVSPSIEKRVINALSQIEGAYSLLLMINDTMIAARDPFGFRPLCLGKLEGAYIVASETCALDLINATYVRDIEPGEIVFIENGKLRSVKAFEPQKHAHCIFEHIYFARPDSMIFGETVYNVRKKLGACLAEEAKVEADFVMPIPDSGSFAALGYAQRSQKPFELGIIRNHYIGRTFIQPSQFTREFKVRVKLNPIKNVLNGKNVVVVEDSIVRGTTSQNRVKTLRNSGAKKIHFCVSCPPIKNPCFYGIDFPSKKELIAANKSIEQIKDFIGADSLHYLSLNGMLDSVGIDKQSFCTACFSGKYPTKIPTKFSKKMLEKNK